MKTNKALIVDDSQLLRDRIRQVLEKFSEISLIKEVDNSIEAIEYTKIFNPRIIVLDIRIYGDNGIKALQQIRKNGYKGRIIILTNFPFPIYKAKCLEYGADYFLSKTDDFDRLPNIVSEILNNG